MELSNYPQSAELLGKLRASMRACAEALGFDLKRNPLAVHQGYVLDTIDDYDLKSVESAFAIARSRDFYVEHCLESGDLDGFASNLGHLALTTAFLSSLVRKEGEHKDSLKHAKVTSGPQRRAAARQKVAFQARVKMEEIRVDKIDELLRRPGYLELVDGRSVDIVRKWYAEVFPGQLKGGRPPKK